MGSTPQLGRRVLVMKGAGNATRSTIATGHR